jgi:hypothetical protein
MRAALIALVVLLLPAALSAGTMGLYFTYTPVQMTYSPGPYEEFTAYVYLHNMECYVDAAEFKLNLPAGISMSTFELPEGSLNLGDPIVGLSATYWPPLNGFYPGYDLLCTVYLYASRWCTGTSTHYLAPNSVAAIVPEPEAGRLAVTCWPDNNIVDVTGLISYFCPEQIGTQDKSWGAIKSLYDK